MTSALSKGHLIVETPPGHDPEWNWILGVIVGDRFGLSWTRMVKSELREVRIRIDSGKGMLTMPATYFLRANEEGIDESCMPREPLTVWHPTLRQDRAALSEETIPVLFGETSGVEGSVEDRIPIDIFGSAFFTLARIEEVFTKESDSFDRFAASQSIAVRAGFINRPIIDEYVELLQLRLMKIWPSLPLHQPNFRMLVSHDVDAPSVFGLGDKRYYLRGVYLQILRERRFKLLPDSISRVLRAPNSLSPHDPFNTFDWLMDQSEACGIRSAFYFFGARTGLRQDAAYGPSHPSVRKLMRSIHQRGHEIGLHPSFNTYNDPNQLAQEANTLRQVCGEEGIEQTNWGGRMHFLRWQWPDTAQSWAAAGMAYDSTLGFADHAGFRCGTCHEFRAYDPVLRKKISLRLRPLVAMECSIIAERYMGLGYGEGAANEFTRLKSLCRRYQGDFTLLWHNSHFANVEDFELYKAVLSH